MAIIVQDFIISNTADFTGKAAVDGADHNNLVNEATPASDAASSKGLIVTSTDGLGNVPDVPDVALYGKYAGYLWVRRLLDDTFKMYVWIPTIADHDVIFKKWTDIAQDLTTILADIASAQVDITALQVLVAVAQARADSAYDLASDALVAAQTAETNAATALTTAQTAQTRADDAHALATVANNSIVAYIARLKSYDSGLIPVIFGNTILNATHLLGGTPTSYRATLVCIADDGAYVTGEEYPLEYFAHNNPVRWGMDEYQPKTGIRLVFTSTHVKCYIYGLGLRAYNPELDTVYDITAAKWNLRVTAQRFV